MPLNDQQIRALLVASRETQVDEIDCDEFLTNMARYAETLAAGLSVPATLAKVEAHERLCANCAEGCAVLVELVRAERRGGD